MGMFNVLIPLRMPVYLKLCCGVIFLLMGIPFIILQLRNAEIEKESEAKNFTLPRNWYFSDGTEYPEKQKDIEKMLFPYDYCDDRIEDQLMTIPEGYIGYDASKKYILMYDGLSNWGNQSVTRGAFNCCPVNQCSLTENLTQAISADAIIYRYNLSHPPTHARSAHQVWIYYSQESTSWRSTIKYYYNLFNWTATYRHDSTIAIPYAKWIYYDSNVRQKVQNHNYAYKKNKKVAWFVSHCITNNNRMLYVNELSKYISVDIYGHCGNFRCPRFDKCIEILDRDYKFYLAFENSNCQEYITEKLYENALGHNTLPIVMGAPREDYERAAPEHSYIHVDEFESPAELAAYLHKLDNDDQLYNSYFKWKGTGEFINTHFWCRLCTLLHTPHASTSYPDINEWLRGKASDVCTD